MLEFIFSFECKMTSLILKGYFGPSILTEGHLNHPDGANDAGQRTRAKKWNGPSLFPFRGAKRERKHVRKTIEGFLFEAGASLIAPRNARVSLEVNVKKHGENSPAPPKFYHKYEPRTRAFFFLGSILIGKTKKSGFRTLVCGKKAIWTRKARSCGFESRTYSARRVFRGRNTRKQNNNQNFGEIMRKPTVLTRVLLGKKVCDLFHLRHLFKLV